MNLLRPLIAAAIAASILSPSCGAAPLSRASMRGFGEVEIKSQVFGEGATRQSWVTFTAEDASHAALIASKYKADLLGFGDIKAQPGAATVLALPGSGLWQIGINGSKCEVLFARTAKELSALAVRAGAATWKPAADRAYPRWLDCFDNAGTGVWWGGGGAPTTIPDDFQWAKDRGFTLCDQPPIESRYIAPGVIDTSTTDWFGAMAAKYDIPYRTLLWGHKPKWAWNRIPLPYVRSSTLAVPEPRMYAARGAINDAYEPISATNFYTMDFRRRFSTAVDADPNYVGGHALGEVPDAGVHELASVSGDPEFKALWHSYLVNTLGLDLTGVGMLYKGSKSAYKTWDDVAIPTPEDFLGVNSRTVKLNGTWEGLPDRDKVGVTAKWYTPDGAPKAGWKAINSNDPIMLMYGGGTSPKHFDRIAFYWLRRTVTITPEQLPYLKFLQLARAQWHGGDEGTFADAFINGQPLAQSPKDQGRSIALTFDVAGSLHVGENTIVLSMHGSPPAGLIALGEMPLRSFPFMTPGENRLWYDATNFDAWLRMRNLENNLKAMRAGDPNRPLKVMATINMLDMSQDLCAKYGAYQHDTGGAGGYWAPMTGGRLAKTHGLPWSCEQGGPPADAEAMQRAMTFYLMYGNDAVDLVFGVTHYRDNKSVAEWVDKNNALMHCIGKMSLPKPKIAILRSTRATRFGFSEPWSWDVGRGTLQAVGRNFTYVEVPDIASGVVNDYPVIIDDGTVLMTPEEVDGLIKYVRAGGIFIAEHMTGMHSPDMAYSWPISKLTGLSVMKDREVGMQLKFSATETLWPTLRGQETRGYGRVLDFRDLDLTGKSIAMEKSANDVEVIAEWATPPAGEGKIAIARRRIGRGQVITMGSTAWMDTKDVNGIYKSSPDASSRLDEMLTSLGVPRDSWTGTPEVWGEHWVSKNGVYDVYQTARMQSKVTEPLSTTVALRRDTPVKEVIEVTTDGHPRVSATWAAGRLTLPAASYSPMQARFYAAPRADLENAAIDWMTVQAEHWRSLPPMSPLDKPEVVTVPDDIIPAADGWKLSTAQPAASTDWVKPVFGDGDWKAAKLGTFAALGLPEDGVAQLRKMIAIPESWKGKRISLVFDAEWSYGISGGTLWINGAPAPLTMPLKTYGNTSFTVDVTEQAKSGSITLALALDGKLPPDVRRGRPAGVTGMLYLQADDTPVSTTPLPNGWQSASDANDLTPAVKGKAVKAVYMETRFTLPKTWPSKRVFLASPNTLGGLIVNDQIVDTPGWMTKLDISGLVKPTGENIIRWVPKDATALDFKRASLMSPPDMRLDWMP
ncbi:MAG TPA: hypothetical protein VGK19_04255 [Capsulimonadaceae bacterium]|jgi:hypothetical protein